MSYGGVSTATIFEILAHAAAIRAERKGIALAVAVDNTLCAAQRDFGIPLERLPSRSELTLIAQAVSA